MCQLHAKKTTISIRYFNDKPINTQIFRKEIAAVILPENSDDNFSKSAWTQYFCGRALAGVFLTVRQ